MTLDLRAVLIIAAAAMIYAALLPSRWRGWALLIGSAAAVYFLQPPLPIRFSDFLLPTVTLTLTTALWWATRAPEQRFTREDATALLLLIGVILALALMRFVDAPYRLTPSRPPDPLMLAVGLLVSSLALAGGWQLARRLLAFKARLALLIALLAGVFIVWKTEALALVVSAAWRGATGQDAALAGMGDLNWLGFSYVAFRLIHLLRDRMSGLLPALTLREHVTYAIFFPSFIAGPIDRAERFADDLRALPALAGLDAPRWIDAAGRITTGLVKKFVIADGLAQGMALNPVNAAQTDAPLWLWLLLYGYGLRLFFDFSGYSDIAIGLGLLFGVRLPENFNRPYLRTSITAFWQSWHITLSSWARFYVFLPLSRALLLRQPRPAPALVALAGQSATMLLIGLWHGVTLNFVLWGLWHALALFVHKQWSDRTRAWYRRLDAAPRRKRLWTAAAWFITFHYVMLGWVWFALPDAGQAARALLRLFGL